MRTDHNIHLWCIQAAIWFAIGVWTENPASANAQSAVEQFYRGKTIEIVIGQTPGGTYDGYARLVARHLSNHIPGSPTIVVRNMPGAGGRIAFSYIHEVAPKDGTALGAADQALPLAQALGDDTLKFDTRELIWIGNPIADNNIVNTWHTSGIRTIDDARKKEVTIGANGFDTSSQYPTALNAIAGTKFKVIFGYPGGSEINLAMEKGEVDGRGSNGWSSWKSTRPDWLRDSKLYILAQVGLQRAMDLPDVPTLIDLAINDVDRAAMRLLSAPTALGRPLVAPPSTPPDRVEALRDAFDATMKDPAFLDDAKNLNMDINSVTGAQLQQIVNEIIDAPSAAKQRLSAILAPLIAHQIEK